MLVEKLFCSIFNPLISLYIYYDQYEKYGEKKISPRFVPIEMAAIFDFMALTKVYITLKPVLEMQRKVAHTHRRHINEETYTSVLVLLNITFEIFVCV